MLERRVNEWLGNNCHPRYLLGLRELLSIRRQKPYLVWGTKRRQKEQLLDVSWRRIYIPSMVLIALALIMVSFAGWLRLTPQGQIQQVRWGISNPLGSSLERVSDERAAQAAVAIAKEGRWQAAFKLVEEHVQHYEARGSFVTQFAEVVSRQNTNQAQAQLKRALAVAQDIDDPGSQSLALREIAAAYAQLEDSEAAQSGLAATLRAAQASDNPYSQREALREIAAAYAQLENPEAAQEGLAATLRAAQASDDPRSQSEALRGIAAAAEVLLDPNIRQSILHDTLEIAEAANAEEALAAISRQYALDGHWGQALRALRRAPESVKVSVLADILTLWAEKQNPQLIDGAVILPPPQVTGDPGNYTFEVSIYSGDQGDDQYADWWEVLSEDGKLLYRQVFDEPHFNEQPFTSSGKPVNIEPDQEVIVRAHLHTEVIMHANLLHIHDEDDTGYEAKQAWKGSVENGFKFIRLSENFAASVAKEEPQPATER